ncbi:hypothetical protein SLS54_007271 [Diplodia seriata]
MGGQDPAVDQDAQPSTNDKEAERDRRYADARRVAELFKPKHISGLRIAADLFGVEIPAEFGYDEEHDERIERELEEQRKQEWAPSLKLAVDELWKKLKTTSDQGHKEIEAVGISGEECVSFPRIDLLRIQFGAAVTFSKSGEEIRMLDSPDPLGPFKNTVTNPLLLYDVPLKRGWLVPEILGIWLLFINWAKTHPKELQEKILDEVMPDTTEDFDAQTALKQVRELLGIGRKGDVMLPLSGRTPGGLLRAFDIFEMFRNQISYIKEQSRPESSLGWTIPICLPGNRILQGVEFMDVVESKNTEQKNFPITKETGGSWSSMVSHDPDIIALVGSKFGDILRPGKESQAQGQTNPLAEEIFHVAADVKCLLHTDSKGKTCLKLGDKAFLKPNKSFNWEQTTCHSNGLLFDKNKTAWNFSVEKAPEGSIFLGRKFK